MNVLVSVTFMQVVDDAVAMVMHVHITDGNVKICTDVCMSLCLCRYNISVVSSIDRVPIKRMMMMMSKGMEEGIDLEYLQLGSTGSLSTLH